jgi:hypothetical protein
MVLEGNGNDLIGGGLLTECWLSKDCSHGICEGHDGFVICNAVGFGGFYDYFGFQDEPEIVG